jgi:hypothetical protein
MSPGALDLSLCLLRPQVLVVPWSMPSRPVLVLLVAFAVLAAGGSLVLADNVRTAQAERAAEEHAARATVDREVERRHQDVAPAAMQAHDSARVLRSNLAETLSGSARDAEELGDERDEQLQRLRANADEMAATTAERRGSPAARHDGAEFAAFDRLGRLDARVTTTAAQLRRTADDAERWATIAEGLARQAAGFASRDLPSTEDPGELAARWRSEVEELADYREAAERASEEPGLEAVGDAHLRLVDGMEDLAADATALLEDEEVDAYNDLLEDRLGDADPFGFAAALEVALGEAAAQ